MDLYILASQAAAALGGMIGIGNAGVQIQDEKFYEFDVAIFEYMKSCKSEGTCLPRKTTMCHLTLRRVQLS